MKINWNFLGGGGGVQNKKPSVGGVWIFSETAHLLLTSHRTLGKKGTWQLSTVLLLIWCF